MKNYNKDFKSNLFRGFTLIELLVVIAIISILATITYAVLTTSRDKGKDAKIVSQVGSMKSQSLLFSGTTGVPTESFSPYLVSAGILGAQAGGSSTYGALFNDTDLSSNSLYSLASKLPGGTRVYYGWNGSETSINGKWFFIASTSKGAFCVDHSTNTKSYEGGSLDNEGDLEAWLSIFPNAQEPDYLCQ